ncbi:MAG: C40 family peptidase [Steroidobacteraceae bacterium]|nr:C40 family peptidase [Steroidobacteraceae bacterium]
MTARTCWASPPITTRALLLAVLLAGLAACTPFRPGLPGDAASTDPGRAVLQVAQSRIGAPYRYGGAGPDAFDCSGLVAYAYGQVGVAVPRTAAQQFAVAAPVQRGELRPGDLVFFRLASRNVSHVGIYAGGDQFVHAPQSGGNVRMASLDEDLFRRSFAGGGRLHSLP